MLTVEGRDGFSASMLCDKREQWAVKHNTKTRNLHFYAVPCRLCNHHCDWWPDQHVTFMRLCETCRCDVGQWGGHDVSGVGGEGREEAAAVGAQRRWFPLNISDFGERTTVTKVCLYARGQFMLFAFMQTSLEHGGNSS